MNSLADSLQNIVDQVSPMLRSKSEEHVRKSLAPASFALGAN